MPCHRRWHIADMPIAYCRALREKVLAQANPDSEEARPSDGTYKGLNNYTDYTKVRKPIHHFASASY